jgi:crotonobetainyl-CoA:carnitine CoA-transferase CaiB-like acyl-CoA transferase
MSDNIFSGLKVVDLASFIAGPGAAVILSDFGADVIKVEPPSGDTWRIGYRVPPQPMSEDNYPWHLNNRNKRGLSVDLKSPEAREIIERLARWADVMIVNTPHPARERLGLGYDGLAQFNPRLIYADLTGFGDAGPDAHLPGFDLTAYWARSGLLAMTHDAGTPPTMPISGSGDHATAVGLYSAIVTGLYRRERTGRGSYVTTSLLAQGVWATGVMVQGALAHARFYPPHDRANPPNPLANLYRTADDVWFVLLVTPANWPALTKAVGRGDLLTDARFADAAKVAENAGAVTSILDAAFVAHPMSYWAQALDAEHITYGPVRSPAEAISDPQLRANNIVVPLAGAGGHLTETISSPISVHNVEKVASRRAPELGEHNDEVLTELGFTPGEIDDFEVRGVVASKQRHAA